MDSANGEEGARAGEAVQDLDFFEARSPQLIRFGICRSGFSTRGSHCEIPLWTHLLCRWHTGRPRSELPASERLPRPSAKPSGSCHPSGPLTRQDASLLLGPMPYRKSLHLGLGRSDCQLP